MQAQLSCSADFRFASPDLKTNQFMRRALALASRGLGKTQPNPCVGAVIVKNGRIVGEGWHRAAGLPHAEVEAIHDAKRKGINLRGSTMFVTLEPCCTWGRTPPCTDAVLREGIRKVIVGAVDPNPKHRGRGLTILKRKGVKVTEGILEEECAKLNSSWNHWIVHGTPWVIAKCGMTLDGKIATEKGESQWITSEKARKEGRKLRSWVDAVLVGVNTVVNDNPRLTVRDGKAAYQPVRVILDTHARTPVKSKILKSEGRREKGEVVILVGPKASRQKMEKFRRAGADVIVAATRNIGKVLQILGKRGIRSLLVEGGGEALGSFFIQKQVHEVVFFIAPAILGGRDSIRAVAGPGFSEWQKSSALDRFQVREIGTDLMVTGIVKNENLRKN